MLLKDPSPLAAEGSLLLRLGAGLVEGRGFRRIVPERLTRDELIAELDRAMQIPGVTNAWTMPIKARIDMLSTGVRTPVGVKVLGPRPQHAEHWLAPRQDRRTHRTA